MRATPHILCLLLTLLALGCGEVSEEPLRTVGLEIEPSVSLAAIGEARQFHAVAVAEDGTRHVVEEGVVWTSEMPGMASVDEAGIAMGADLGEAAIQATFEGFEAQAPLTIVSSPVIALGLTPETPLVEVGESVHITVTATFADDTSLYVTPHVVWESSAPGVAVVEEARVTGVSPGEAIMTATIGEVSGTIRVQVSPARVTP